MRAFLAGAEWDLHEVRYLWQHDGVFLIGALIVLSGTPVPDKIEGNPGIHKEKGRLKRPPFFFL